MPTNHRAMFAAIACAGLACSGPGSEDAEERSYAAPPVASTLGDASASSAAPSRADGSASSAPSAGASTRAEPAPLPLRPVASGIPSALSGSLEGCWHVDNGDEWTFSAAAGAVHVTQRRASPSHGSDTREVVRFDTATGTFGFSLRPSHHACMVACTRTDDVLRCASYCSRTGHDYRWTGDAPIAERCEPHPR